MVISGMTFSLFCLNAVRDGRLKGPAKLNP
jgi:hypothetical protein